MSKENAKKFFAEIEKNAELKDKYIGIMAEHQKALEKSMAEKMVALGKTAGFAFSEKDIFDLRAEFIDSNNNNGELDDADLMKVAGGNSAATKAGNVIMSILSLGFGCALVSAVAEGSKKGGCGKYFNS